MQKFILITLMIYPLIAKESFNLNGILKKVKQNNTQLAIEDINIKQSSLKKQQNQKLRFGEINIKAGYTSYDDKRTLTPLAPPISPNTPTSQDIATATIAYNVTIFDGFTTPSKIAIADITSNQARLNKQLTLAQLRYNATSLYFKILAIKESIQSNQASIDSLEHLYEQRKLALSLGKSTKLELLKIQTRALNQQAMQEDLFYNLYTLKLQLAHLMGYDAEFEIQKQSFNPAFKEKKENINQTLILQNAKKTVQKSNIEVIKAKAKYYPKLYFETFHTRAYANEGDDSYYQGGVYLQWNIVDFGVKKDNLEIARLAKLKANKILHNTYNEHKIKILQAKRQIQKNKTILQASKQELTLALKIESVEKIKFDNGAATIQDLLDYKAQSLKAQTTLNQAKYDLINSIKYYEFLTTKDTK